MCWGGPDPQLSEEGAVALNATNIASDVEGFMTTKGLVFETLRRIGTDGAPVMRGKKGGAVKLLTDKQKAVTAPQSSQAVGIHCGAHRAQPSSKPGCKGSSVCRQIQGPPATRWPSFGGSCAAVRNNLEAITVSLSQEAEKRNDIKAAGLLKFILNERFVGTLLMMCELLPYIDRLSRALQTSNTAWESS